MEARPGLAAGSPDGGEEPRHHRKRRKKTSWGALALLGVCLLGGLTVPLVHALLPRYKVRSAALDLRPEVPADLSLGDAEFDSDGAGRRIIGSVRNNSSHRYANVVVTLNLHIDSDSTAALAVGKIPSIEPNHAARFQTGPIPPPIRRFFVRSIQGDRQ